MESQAHKHEIAKDAENLERFREALSDWMTSGDGQDYCPECWLKYLDKVGKLEAEHARKEPIVSAFRNIENPGSATESLSQVTYAKKDAKPTAQLFALHRCRNGWLVMCENYIDCHQEVFIPDK